MTRIDLGRAFRSGRMLPRLAAAGLLVSGLPGHAFAQESARVAPERRGAAPAATAQLGRLPLAFIENQGQWETPARFVARRNRQTARFEKDALILTLRPVDELASDAVVRLEFEGADPGVTLEGVARQRCRYNYFLGADPAKWRADVPAFSEVLYRGLQSGVDMRVHEMEGRLEYDLILAPHADLAKVVIRCRGGDGIELAADGTLSIQTPLGAIRQTLPTTWQETATGARVPVECRYRRLDGERFGFEAAARDENRPLVIDPGLDWSTYLGGSSDDQATCVAVDDAGLVDVSGSTWSSTFPTTLHAFRTTLRGTRDAFFSRLDPTQTGSAQLVWSTYFGGGGDDDGYTIVPGPSGLLYVSGYTNSPTFPTKGAFMSARSGIGDGFVAEFDPSQLGLNQLVWSTLFGGNGDDGAIVAFHGVDSNGIVTIAGSTDSSNLPTTAAGYAGSIDEYVARLDPSQPGAAQLVACTYLGGSGEDKYPAAFEVAANGEITVAGVTYSGDFPTTAGSFSTVYGGSGDGFIARLDPTLANLVYSTYFGGTKFEQINSVRIADDGTICFSGTTSSTNLPTTANCYNATYNGGAYDAFIGHLDPAGNGTNDLLYSTYLGGSGDDRGHSIALDHSGEVTVNGPTSSTGFPTTAGAFQATYAGGAHDTFVVRMRCANNGAADLTYSSFVGGSDDEWAGYGEGVALDANDFPVLVGMTNSSIFPTMNPCQGALAGGYDAFLTRLALASWFNYGSGLAGTNGVPTFTSQTNPVIGGSMTLDVGNSLGAATPALLLVGLSDANLPAAGGTLLVNAFLFAPISLPATGLSMVGSIPNLPTLAGVSVYLQTLEADPGAVHAISFTPGLRLVLGY